MSNLWKSVCLLVKSHKVLSIVLAASLVVSGTGFGGYKAVQAMKKAPVEEIVEETVEEAVEETAAPQVEVPKFKKVNITSESVEKDLSIFISDENDEAITGINFKVKVASPDGVEVIKPYVDAIDQINKEIDEIQNGGQESTVEVSGVKITNEDGTVENQAPEVGRLDQLLIDKEVAMEAYGIALEGIEGDVLVDDDADGVITQKEYKPGDYVALLLYDNSVEINYEPTTYQTAVNVKDKLETKVVENIKKIIKKDDAKEDSKKEAAPAVEATLKDTVEFVESSDEATYTYEESQAVAPTKTYTAKVTNTDKAKVSHDVTVKAKYNVTVEERFYGEDGATEDTSKYKEVSKTTVEDGAKFKVPAIVNVDGYTCTCAEAGSEVEIKSDRTFTFKYVKNKTEQAPEEYTVTINYEYSAPEGTENVPANTSETKKITKGQVYKVDVPTVDGYDYVVDPTNAETDGITVDGDKIITVKYTLKSARRNGGNRTAFNSFAERFLRDIKTNVSVVNAAAATSYTQRAEIGVKGDTDLTITVYLSGSPAPTLESITADGVALSVSGDKATYKPDKEGQITLAGNVKYADGATGQVSIVVTSTGTYDKKQVLKNADGETLYIDEKGSREATAEDYKEGAKFYKKITHHVYKGWQSINGATYYFDKDGNKVTGSQVIQGIMYNFGSDGALVVNGTGIDVSKYQGNIDWAQAKSAVSFAIVRCGYRGQSDGCLHEDPYFYQNMKNAKANGVGVGVYIFSRALNEAEAVEEASMAVAMANSAGGCSYPIYIDMEDSSRGQIRLSNAERTAIINAFCSTVASAGYKTGVYANKTWLTKYINTGDLSGSINIWVAQYNTSCTYSGRYTMWQYSSKGSIPGIKGNVDVNKSYF